MIKIFHLIRIVQLIGRLFIYFIAMETPSEELPRVMDTIFVSATSPGKNRYTVLNGTSADGLLNHKYSKIDNGF